MQQDNAIDVFISYARADRERVKPIVDLLKAQDLDVFWDPDVPIGSRWRHVLEDRLEHAHAVCVFWTATSVTSDFVLDEAGRGKDRGVLLTVLLDPVTQPLGFGQLQRHDLSQRSAFAEGMSRLIDAVRALVTGGVPVTGWQSNLRQDYSITRTKEGLAEARQFLAGVRVRTDMLTANPGAADALRGALRGVRDTYVVVGEAMDTFLAPLSAKSSPSSKPSFGPQRYRRLLKGRLVAQIGRDRGHCKRIAQAYIEDGGLREGLPASTPTEVVDELDDLIERLSTADGDLFDAMASIGSSIEAQAGVLTNLLVAGQVDEAWARLTVIEGDLTPLRRQVSEGMADVEALATELGVVL